jgi:hypothetical protein
MQAQQEIQSQFELYGPGSRCIWIPGRKYSFRQRLHESVNATVVQDELNRAGFFKAKFTRSPDDTERTARLELFGPDSPADFVYEYTLIHPDENDDGGHFQVDEETRNMVYWVWERETASKEMGDLREIY